jgi:hypothetical protein
MSTLNVLATAIRSLSMMPVGNCRTAIRGCGETFAERHIDGNINELLTVHFKNFYPEVIVDTVEVDGMRITKIGSGYDNTIIVAMYL